MMKTVSTTIFTPTYNRGELLKILYDSLVRQTIKDFEWVIVDDGSSDNTKEIVEEFIAEKKLDITYIYKKNEGKHIAINTGLDIAKGEAFFIVDSDDYLCENALELVMENWKEIKDDSSFVGVAGLRGYSEDTVIGSEVNDTIINATSIDYRYIYKITGDRAEVFKTDILKRYKFPKIEGSNFITECVIWNKLSEDGFKLRWFNKIIYVTKYREDGLTNNMRNIALKNWRGTVYSNNELLGYSKIPLKYKVRIGMDYYHYGLYGKIKLTKLIKECKCKKISFISIPLSFAKLIFTYKKIRK